MIVRVVARLVLPSMMISAFNSIPFCFHRSIVVVAARRRVSCQRFMMSTDQNDGTLATLAPGSHEADMEVKKSKFLGYAQHVQTWKEAQDYLTFVRSEHPKARHICFGYVAGTNPVQERCFDDGEPTGTAGLPILGGIKGEGLSDVVCAVVRYFGGIKLGAGGLIRAYGGTARLVLREAPKEVLLPKTCFRVSLSSSNAGAVGVVYDAVSKVGGTASDEEYTADGDFILTVTCETQQERRLRNSLTDGTRGAIEFLVDDDKEA